MKASLSSLDIAPHHTTDAALRATPDTADAPGSLIRAVIDQTATPARPSTAPVFITGKCLTASNPDIPGRCRVAFTTPDGCAAVDWLRHMKGHTIRTNDEVLLVYPGDSKLPVVIGAIAATEPAAPPAVPGGRRLVIDREIETNQATAIRLESADGQPLVEIDLKTEVPTIRLPGEDLSMDITGRLKIAARSIDLESKLGNVNVKANDDFKVNAERIYLN